MGRPNRVALGRIGAARLASPGTGGQTERMVAYDPFRATDIRIAGAWERALPLALVPYSRLARWDRPIGFWLLLLPCWWGMALALAAPGGDGGVTPFQAACLAVLFAAGAVAMRGAGCTYNDIVDRDFDARVARTAVRPLPAGHVGVRGAWAFALMQCAVGAAVLVLMGGVAVPVALTSLPLVAAYPFMKRLTWWPQAWLGLTFNWGVLVGWAAVTDGLAWPAVALYGAGIAWTLGYDTIYAHQDKEDDALVGVKSTARLFGGKSRIWIGAFYGTALAGLAAAGGLSGLGWPFHLGLLAVAGHFAWQVATLDADNPDRCLALFRSNLWAGFLVVGAIAVGA